MVNTQNVGQSWMGTPREEAYTEHLQAKDAGLSEALPESTWREPNIGKEKTPDFQACWVTRGQILGNLLPPLTESVNFRTRQGFL